MTSRPFKLLGIAGGSVGLMATAYLMIMTTFMIYDDEGFVLMTLRQFLGGQALYDEVFSQYGPSPYLYHWCLTLAGSLELTHMFGRIVTLFHWVICALSVGWISSQLVERHRCTTGVFATLFSFNLLWQMIAEPSHPGSMIAALLAVSAVLSVKLIHASKNHALAATLGLTGAILIFTKINVGAFFIAGTGAFALCHTAWPQAWRKPADLIALAGLFILPWLLMAGNLHDPAMFGFALKASLASAGVWWIIPRLDQDSHLPPQTWMYCVGWFLLGTLGISGFVLWQGTSLPELFSAVFIDPIRQPGKFTVPPSNTAHSAIVAGISFVIVAWAGWNLRRLGRLHPVVQFIAVAARLILVSGFIWFATSWPAPWGVFTYLDYVLPLLPLWLVPTSAGAPRPSLPLALLACISVTQVLHAYPVAGSQIGWGCFLSIPIIARGIQRDLCFLARQQPAWLPLGFAGAVLIAAGSGTATLVQTGWQRYQSSQPLPFAGASDIRLDDRTRIALTAVVQNAMVHGDVLFSRQGMYSFNIWSQIPTPTNRNATHWFWLLDEQEQQGIINRLASTDRSVLIVNEPLDAFLEQIDVEVSGPLQDYIEENYRSAFNLRGSDFRISHDRHIAELGWGYLLQQENGDSREDQKMPFSFMLDAIIQGLPHSIEIVEFDAAGNAHPSDLGLTDMTFAPIRSDGSFMAERKPLDQAGRLEGIYNFSGKTDRSAAEWNYYPKGVVIKDAAGTILAEALLE